MLLSNELEKVPAAQSWQVRFTLLLPATRTRLPGPHMSQLEHVVLAVPLAKVRPCAQAAQFLPPEEAVPSGQAVQPVPRNCPSVPQVQVPPPSYPLSQVTLPVYAVTPFNVVFECATVFGAQELSVQGVPVKIWLGWQVQLPPPS